MAGAFRTRLRWVAPFVLLLLVATACGGGAEEEAGGAEGTETEAAAGATAESEGEVAAQEGGRIVFGADQEPKILNPWLQEGNLTATSRVTLPVLLPAWRILPDFSYEPLMYEGEPEITSEDPFTVSHTIKEEAAWSDGETIDAEDFRFTFETCLNEEFDIASREGCDKIDFDASTFDGKTMELVFTEPYAPWRTLLSTTPVLPQHVLEGEDFNSVFNDELPIASGPFQFEAWNKGQDLTITRNDNWWGDDEPNLDEIVFRFIEDSNSQLQALQGQEIDAIDPQPQLDFVEQVEADESLTAEIGNGPVWEHIDFNFVVEPLDQLFVREAIAMGIDRETIVQELIAPLNPNATPLNNAYYVENQEEYEPQEYPAFDPEGARALLEENGCSEGDGGIYECDGTPLEFDYVTTAGNELRELQFEVIQAQLSDIGIQLNSALEPADSAFGTTLLAGEEGAWDIFGFAWAGSPDPAGANQIWVCDGTLNEQSYCNEQHDELIQQTNTAIDPAERADLYNQAAAILAEDLPIYPLYQKPQSLFYNDRVTGMELNATQWGATWNTEDWGLRAE